jgi:hypothetical protein
MCRSEALRSIIVVSKSCIVAAIGVPVVLLASEVLRPMRAECRVRASSRDR